MVLWCAGPRYVSGRSRVLVQRDYLSLWPSEGGSCDDLRLCALYGHGTLDRSVPATPLITGEVHCALGDRVARRASGPGHRPARYGAGDERASDWDDGGLGVHVCRHDLGGEHAAFRRTL